jgi:hypothetical protein
MEDGHEGFGGCIEQTTRQALREWHLANYRGEELVDAIGMHLDECEAIAKVKPGGRVEVIVQLTDRHPGKCYSLFARWGRVARGRYRLENPSLNV